MSWSVLCHDQGCVDYLRSFDTKQSAISYAKDLRKECEEHPTWYDLAAPWFEVVKGNHQPDPGIDHEQWAAAGCDQW